MAETVGHPVGALDRIKDLSEEPWRYELFAAIRLLQALHPDYPRVGTSSRMAQDFVRFKQHPTLAMSPAEILSFARRPGDQGNPDGPYEMVSSHFGMFGPDGALPNWLTEEVIQDHSASRNKVVAEFVDLFHHRLYSLLYRAFEATQIAVSRDRPGDDPYERFLNAFYGMSMSAFRDRDALPDDTRRHLAGHLSSNTPSAQGLSSVVEKVVGVRVKVEEFVGEWLDIAGDQRVKFGMQMRLGADIVVGDRYFSVQSRLRIRTERLTIEQYRDLLPCGTAFNKVRDVARSYLGLATGWELQPVLDARQVPALKLDGTKPLGWETWLLDDLPLHDADDLVLEGSYTP